MLGLSAVVVLSCRLSSFSFSLSLSLVAECPCNSFGNWKMIQQLRGKHDVQLSRNETKRIEKIEEKRRVEKYLWQSWEKFYLSCSFSYEEDEIVNYSANTWDFFRELLFRLLFLRLFLQHIFRHHRDLLSLCLEEEKEKRLVIRKGRRGSLSLSAHLW